MDDFALGSDNDNDEIILDHPKKNTDVTDTVKDTDTNDVTISSGRITTPISVDTPVVAEITQGTHQQTAMSTR